MSTDCKDASLSNDIAQIQKIGGYIYGILYAGFLVCIFIAATWVTYSKSDHQQEIMIPVDADDKNKVNHNNKPKNKKSCFTKIKTIGHEMMRLRNIYFVIIVHLFDTLTDFLIALEWYIKGDKERKNIIDCPNINYLGCFYVAMVILLFYRILSARYIYQYYQQTRLKAILSSIAQFLDIAIFNEVYQSHIHSSQTDNLSYLSKLEKTFESSPQLILQTYVLMRELSQDIPISVITVISILFSLISLSTKVIADDRLMFTKEASKKNKIAYLARAAFRICEITQRLLAISLFATFFGANFLVVIIFIDLLTNLLLFDHGLLDSDGLNVMSYLLCTMNVGIIPTSDHQLIPQSFIKKHTIFHKIWDSLFIFITRFQCIVFPKFRHNVKCDHYLSFYLVRSKCVQSLFILIAITVFALIDSNTNWHFRCAICTKYEGRKDLYDNDFTFLIFLIVGYVSVIVTYITYSYSVQHMLTGMILDRSPWILFINFNFFDAIRAFKERNGPNSFKIDAVLKLIVDRNARLPTIVSTKEDDIISSFPQLPYLLQEINNNLSNVSILYDLLELAIKNLHDNFVSFFLNPYIIEQLNNLNYSPQEYKNKMTNDNLLEIAMNQQNNIMIKTVYICIPQLLERNDYRRWFELWQGKYAATIRFMVDNNFDLIKKPNPMTKKSIIFECIDKKLYSILLTLLDILDGESRAQFASIKYQQWNIVSYAVKSNDTSILDLFIKPTADGTIWAEIMPQQEMEYIDYHNKNNISTKYYCNIVSLAVLNNNETILAHLLNELPQTLITAESRCIFGDKEIELNPLLIAVSRYPKCDMGIMKLLFNFYHSGASNVVSDLSKKKFVTNFSKRNFVLDMLNDEDEKVIKNLFDSLTTEDIKYCDNINKNISQLKKEGAHATSVNVYMEKIIQTDNIRAMRLLMKHFKVKTFEWKSGNDTFSILCARYNASNILQEFVADIDDKTREWIKYKDAKSRRSPFDEAKSSKMCELLLLAGYNIPIPTQPLNSLLFKICTSGYDINDRIGVAKWLLSNEIRFEKKNKYIRTVIADACDDRIDLYECLPVMIPLCNLNDTFGSNGQSLLHLSVMRCHITTIRILLQNGFDVNIKTNYGNTPLHLLCTTKRNSTIFNRQHRIIYVLIHYYKANVNARNEDGNTPLILCVINENIERIKLLIDLGADINAQNNEGDTVLHIVCREKEKENYSPYYTHMLDVLLFEFNADMSIKNNDGQTPLDIAIEYCMKNKKDTHYYRRIRLLIKAGNNINNTCTNDNETPLQYALKGLNMQLFRLFLSAKKQCETKGILKYLLKLEQVKMDELFIQGSYSSTRTSYDKKCLIQTVDGYIYSVFSKHKTTFYINILSIPHKIKELMLRYVGSLDVFPDFDILSLENKKLLYYNKSDKYYDYFSQLLNFNIDFSEKETKIEYLEKFKNEEWKTYFTRYKEYQKRQAISNANIEMKKDNIEEIKPQYFDFSIFVLNERMDDIVNGIRKDVIIINKDKDEYLEWFENDNHLIQDYRPQILESESKSKEKNNDKINFLEKLNDNSDDKNICELLDVYGARFDNNDESEFVQSYF
eukprot:188919_1